MTPSLFFLNAGMLTITDFINILRHHYKSPIVSFIEALVETLLQCYLLYVPVKYRPMCILAGGIYTSLVC